MNEGRATEGEPRNDGGVQTSGYNSTWQEYLQAIYYLGLEGNAVIGARLAEWLGISAPSVTGMLRRMQAAGLLTMGPRKEILLTEEGRRVAEAVARRHYLAERLLTDVVGLDWAVAHEEAERWQHAISDATEWPLWEALGKPTTCPHGTPIPGLPIPARTGSGPAAAATLPLTEMPEGATGRVERILEDEKEDLSELLTYLGTHRIVPGARVRMVQVAPYNYTTTVQTEDGEVTLGLAVAEKVLVSVESRLPEPSP